jgi:hypothetical protein
MRLSIIGLCLIALAAAWMWQVGWVAILALIILGEETLETTIMIYGLTRGPELRLRP